MTVVVFVCVSVQPVKFKKEAKQQVVRKYNTQKELKLNKRLFARSNTN
jgi:heme exporter protein D